MNQLTAFVSVAYYKSWIEKNIGHNLDYNEKEIKETFIKDRKEVKPEVTEQETSKKASSFSFQIYFCIALVFFLKSSKLFIPS